MIAWLYASTSCLVTVSDLWLFLMVQWACPQCEIVVFPDHTDIIVKIQQKAMLVQTRPHTLYI